jgi:hypothetical protein
MICRLVRSHCSDDKFLKSKVISLPAHISVSFDHDHLETALRAPNHHVK